MIQAYIMRREKLKALGTAMEILNFEGRRRRGKPKKGN